MKLVKESITKSELKSIAEKMDGSLVKAVVDIEQEVIAVDADLHADEEDYLIENGSEQNNLWGINIYPDEIGNDDWIEFDSMINLRPSQNNMSRGVDNAVIRAKIIKVVNKLVTE